MALSKKKEVESEVTITMTVTLTDIIKVPSDDEKAQKQTDSEIKKLEKALNKISGVDNVDVKVVKTFPNIKETES